MYNSSEYYQQSNLKVLTWSTGRAASPSLSHIEDLFRNTEFLSMNQIESTYDTNPVLRIIWCTTCITCVPCRRVFIIHFGSKANTSLIKGRGTPTPQWKQPARTWTYERESDTAVAGKAASTSRPHDYGSNNDKGVDFNRKARVLLQRYILLRVLHMNARTNPPVAAPKYDKARDFLFFPFKFESACPKKPQHSYSLWVMHTHQCIL